MTMLWSVRQCENMDKAAFDGVGKYGIPPILPVDIVEPIEMIGFNFAQRYKAPERVGVHFFLKDYQFTRLWTSPDIYTPMLSRFRFVCTPDFSMYTDYPMALQINSHYRKHWLGAYWQAHGMTVIPTICWADERSFDWCFDGEPVGGTVAVSSVGTQINRRSKRLFTLGFEHMLLRLRPRVVLFHGDMPCEVAEMLNSDNSSIRVVEVLAFQAKLRKIESRDTDGRTRSQ